MQKLSKIGFVLILLGVSSCKEAPAVEQKGDKAEKIAGASFEIFITQPPIVQIGEPFSATVKLVPRGKYKVNKEYPIKLNAKGSNAVLPTEIAFTKKDAKLFSAKEAVFKPTFVASSAGEHRFAGTIKFSVCTEKLCELFNKQVSWVAKVRKPEARNR
ncbi:MAG: hypothetical protein V1754_09145 [Pseudomonadota bacterium]